jgi:hypothetical protein
VLDLRDEVGGGTVEVREPFTIAAPETAAASGGQ